MLINGVKWLVIEKFSLQLSKFLFFIVLARVLGPKDFGVISVSYFFVALCDAFLISGFAHGFIRDKFENRRDEIQSLNSLIFLNLLFGIFLSLIMHYSSCFIGVYYDDSDVTHAIGLLAYTVFVNSIISTMRAKNDKDLNFHRTSFNNIVALMVSYILTYIAYQFEIIELDYKLLLLQIISYKISYLLLLGFSFVKTVDLMCGCSYKKAIQYFNYGWTLQLATLLTSTTQDIATMIIGKKLGLATASIYSRANNLQILSSQLVIQIADRIAFPSFASKFKNNDELVGGSKELLRTLSIIILPIVVITFFNSENIIFLLLGEKWIDAVPVLKILSINGFFRYVQTVHLNLAKLAGNSSIVLSVRIIELALIVIFALLFLSKGLEIFCYILVSINALSTFLLCYYSNVKMGFLLHHQIAALCFPLIINISVGVVVNYIYISWVEYKVFDLIGCCLTYLLFYIGILWLRKEPLVTKFYVFFKGK